MSALSDELLLAYVDGQLDGRQAALVSGRLREDNRQTARVRALQATQAQFVAGFAPLFRDGPRGLADAMPRAVSARIDVPAPTGGASGAALRQWALLAGLAVCVGVAGYTGTSWLVNDMPALPAASGWAAELASSRAEISGESLVAETAASQLARMAGRPQALPDLAELGYDFRRGALREARTGKLLQLNYLRRKGRVPLDLMVTPGGPEQPLVITVSGEAKAASWAAGGVRYALIGRETEPALRRVAEAVANQLARH